jgi:hypothetical protein
VFPYFRKKIRRIVALFSIALNPSQIAGIPGSNRSTVNRGQEIVLPALKRRSIQIQQQKKKSAPYLLILKILRKSPLFSS